jgi:hypothetical protein
MAQTVRIVVVNDDMDVLYDASIPKREIDDNSCLVSYIAQELNLHDLVL